MTTSRSSYMRYLILDIATTAIDGADQFLEPVSAPSNYKDEAKIAAYCAEKAAEQLSKIALDPDCGRISAIGYQEDDMAEPVVLTCENESQEAAALRLLFPNWDQPAQDRTVLIGYNALKFDWPFVMRRALYLGVPNVFINLDRYRTPHIDLFDRLTHHGAITGHSLTWYAKRLGWTDLVKPLSGAEEAKAPADGKWDELRASVRHDVIATKRLAEWMHILTPSEAVA